MTASIEVGGLGGEEEEEEEEEEVGQLSKSNATKSNSFFNVLTYAHLQTPSNPRPPIPQVMWRAPLHIHLSNPSHCQTKYVAEEKREI